MQPTSGVIWGCLGLISGAFSKMLEDLRQEMKTQTSKLETPTVIMHEQKSGHQKGESTNRRHESA